MNREQLDDIWKKAPKGECHLCGRVDLMVAMAGVKFSLPDWIEYEHEPEKKQFLLCPDCTDSLFEAIELVKRTKEMTKEKA